MYKTDLFTKEFIREKFPDYPASFPNDEQLAAISMAVDWFEGWKTRKHRRQVFFLAGWAGTGKTSVAQVIAELCCTMSWVVFIAPTGKAASRLRQKGCPQAQTMHKFIYNVRGKDKETGELIFVAKGDLNERPKLVCLDEASMVGEYDAGKILDHMLPLLALGDPGQIPPVKATAYFMPENADVTLNKIERNDCNIVRGSMYVRDGHRLPVREYDDVKVRQGEVPTKTLLEFAHDDAVVICSYNNTRDSVNRRMRKALGFDGLLPHVGEKIVCTFNQHAYGFMNGEQAIVLGFHPLPEWDADDNETPDMMLVEIRSLTDGKISKVKFNPESFTAKTKDDLNEARKGIGGFDYGYCLTVHKAQGSEWLEVLVIEEILRGIPYALLMYTAITRAIKLLMVHRF